MGLLTALRPLFVARAETTVDGTPLPPPPPLPSREISSIETDETPRAESREPAAPVFLTPQSLASFPGASVGINILWHVVAVVNKDFAKQAFVPLVLAFIIGMLIFIISFSASMSRKEKIVGFLIAFLNAAWLGLNALGINIVKPPSF